VKELKKGSLLTGKYTKVFHEDDHAIVFNAPHHFSVHTADTDEVVTKVDFQKGAIKECGVNGCCNEDLINMVLARLNGFQSSEYKCRENAIAITKLEEALLWLRKRTSDRENRNVEGTHEV